MENVVKIRWVSKNKIEVNNSKILALTSFLEHIMDSWLLVNPILSLLASNNTILGDETEFAPKTMLFVG